MQKKSWKTIIPETEVFNAAKILESVVQRYHHDDVEPVEANTIVE